MKPRKKLFCIFIVLLTFNASKITRQLTSITKFATAKTKMPGKRIFVLAPLLGALIFIFLYIAATFLYPGGSDFNPLSKGFSWQHNYWCNLLNEEAINGKYNAARPIAIAGMFVLLYFDGCILVVVCRYNKIWHHR